MRSWKLFVIEDLLEILRSWKVFHCSADTPVGAISCVIPWLINWTLKILWNSWTIQQNPKHLNDLLSGDPWILKSICNWWSSGDPWILKSISNWGSSGVPEILKVFHCYADTPVGPIISRWSRSIEYLVQFLGSWKIFHSWSLKILWNSRSI